MRKCVRLFFETRGRASASLHVPGISGSGSQQWQSFSVCIVCMKQLCCFMYVGLADCHCRLLLPPEYNSFYRKQKIGKGFILHALKLRPAQTRPCVPETHLSCVPKLQPAGRRPFPRNRHGLCGIFLRRRG